MFLIRNVKPTDYADLLALSRELDSINLPHNPRIIRKMIQKSVASFSSTSSMRGSSKAQYLFVLEDTNRKKVIGTSKIFAHHGTAKKPHVYFQVAYEEVTSKTLGVKFRRKVYQLRTDKKGFTEIGGLVLSRRYYGNKAQLAKQLSYIRFLFMKAHPAWFKKQVIAELLPPLHQGESTLWNFYGYPLTHLSYKKADLLSYNNKEFILKLFPKTDLYFDLLPPEVKRDVEQTGKGSTKAKRLLEKIGFRYVQQIDPFDGGPYFTAPLKKISVYRKTHLLRGKKGVHGKKHLVMIEEKNGVRGMMTDDLSSLFPLSPKKDERVYIYGI